MPLLFGNTASAAVLDIVRSDLVAYYDAAVRTSLTQNAFPNPLDTFEWFGPFGNNNITLSRDTSAGPTPVGGIPMKMIPTGGDPHTGSYNQLISVISPASNGQTWTVSFYAKGSRAGMTVGPLIAYNDASGGAFVFAGQLTSGQVTLTTSWARYSITTTAPTSGGTVTGIQIRWDINDATGNVAGDIVWLDGVQVEANPTVTTFNANSYNIWYDISGVGSSKNLTLTTGIPKIYSDGKYLSFDGSSHKAENTTMSGVLSGLSQGSVCLMYRSKATDNNAMIWDFCNTNGNRDLFSMRQNWAGGQTTGYNGTPGAFGTATFGFSSTNVWKHFAFVRRSNVLYAYVNGVLNNTGTTMVDPIGTINKLIIGQDNINTNFANADYGNFMVYNRGLTDAEVSQNFNYFRAQYGLQEVICQDI